jgi:predicted SAM-dependent methyltransferase
MDIRYFPHHEFPPKLNLGCGFNRLPNYLNVDLQAVHEPDLECDVCRLLPLPSGAYEEILAQDILEHIPRAKCENALLEWNRVLKIGGILVIRVPNILAIASLLQHPNYQRKEQQSSLLQLIFGTQHYHGDTHLNGFTPLSIEQILMEAGFSLEELTQFDETQMQVRARKTHDRAIPPVYYEPSDLDFLRLAYRQFINRAPDLEGLAHYLAQLAEGIPREAVVEQLMVLKRGLFEIPEKHSDLLSIPDDEEFLSALYQRFFDRAPDQEGLSHYISQLSAGCIREEVMSEFLTSEEHLASKNV